MSEEIWDDTGDKYINPKSLPAVRTIYVDKYVTKPFILFASYYDFIDELLTSDLGVTHFYDPATLKSFDPGLLKEDWISIDDIDDLLVWLKLKPEYTKVYNYLIDWAKAHKGKGVKMPPDEVGTSYDAVTFNINGRSGVLTYHSFWPYGNNIGTIWIRLNEGTGGEGTATSEFYATMEDAYETESFKSFESDKPKIDAFLQKIEKQYNKPTKKEIRK
jgi:hypothetical protein